MEQSTISFGKSNRSPSQRNYYQWNHYQWYNGLVNGTRILNGTIPVNGIVNGTALVNGTNLSTELTVVNGTAIPITPQVTPIKNNYLITEKPGIDFEFFLMKISKRLARQQRKILVKNKTIDGLRNNSTINVACV